MKRFMLLFSLLFVTSAWADDLVSCQTKEGSVNVYVNNKLAVSISNKEVEDLQNEPDEDICSRNIVIARNFTTDGDDVLLLPGPLGKNAYLVIYVINYKTNKFKNIGDIPVTANEIKQGIYLDIKQELNIKSIEKYIVKRNAVKRAQPSYYQIFLGKVCIDKNDKNQVKNIEIEHNKQCKGKVISITAKNPICVEQYSDFYGSSIKNTQMSNKICKKLMSLSDGESS